MKNVPSYEKDRPDNKNILFLNQKSQKQGWVLQNQFNGSNIK